MTRFKKLVTRPTLYGLLSILFLWQVLSLCVNSNVYLHRLKPLPNFLYSFQLNCGATSLQVYTECSLHL